MNPSEALKARNEKTVSIGDLMPAVLASIGYLGATRAHQAKQRRKKANANHFHPTTSFRKIS
jgi:hypothetical protein